MHTNFMNGKFILIAFLVHLLLCIGILDIYFKSPMEHNLKSFKATDDPPAKRLFLFVIDGLRASAIFTDDMEKRAPFLAEIIETKGSAGTSFARQPTESRPSHVAILAGMSEDPSNIFKLWKHSLVDFDSAINRSSNAWCWGSAKIIKLFNKNNVTKIHNVACESDSSVFNKTKQFFEFTVKNCSNNCEQYFNDGNIFALFLPTIDDVGLPLSKEYKKSIKLVDENIKNLTNLVESIFNDTTTSYIVTSDHGMTDLGSHGAGSPEETEIPFIAWGAGFKRSTRSLDINQIDIAPLISYLIGIDIPVHSLGIIPTGYLNADKETLALAVLANMEQVYEIFKVKKLRIKSHFVYHIPYKNLDDTYLSRKLIRLTRLAEFKQFESCILEGTHFIGELVQAIEYYQNYYTYPVLFSLGLGYFTWFLFLILAIFASTDQNYLQNSSGTTYMVTMILTIILSLVMFLKLLISNVPALHYLYFLFPFGMFLILNRNFNLSFFYTCGNRTSVLQIVYYLCGLELIIHCFFNRTASSILIILICLSPLKLYTFKEIVGAKEKVIWICCCITLAIFPILPKIKTPFSVFLYLLGTIAWLLVIGKVYQHIKTNCDSKTQLKAFLIQLTCIPLVILYILLLQFKMISSVWVLQVLQKFSWFLLLLPVSQIPKSENYIATRLFGIIIGCIPFYLLVSTNYEIIFSAAYVVTLWFWFSIETSLKHDDILSIIYFYKFAKCHPKNDITTEDFKRAFNFMAFLAIGFFGVGDIATWNSSDSMWVRAFSRKHCPYQTFIIVTLKLMIPFVFTSCIFRAINILCKDNIVNIFSIIFVFCDFMLFHFFFWVTNKGSWFEIGSNLFNFLLMDTLVVIILLLYSIAYLITVVSY